MGAKGKSRKPKDVVRQLQGDGWVLARTRGDHEQYRHLSKPGLVTVDTRVHDIPTGTLRSIYRQAGWTW